MSTARTHRNSLAIPRLSTLLALLAISIVTGPLLAQQAQNTQQDQNNPVVSGSSNAPQTTAALHLPDSPSAVLYSSSVDSSSTATSADPQSDRQPNQSSRPPRPLNQRGWFGYSDAYRASHEASTTEKYILPGQLAPQLTVGDKVELGFIHGISLYSAAGWIVSAEYSQLIDSTPNYGTDSGAYGQRLGAAALRGYSDEVLRDSLMANVFHQDPRYYKMGSRHNIAVRTFYSVSRTLVTRGDDGRLAPNYSLLAGNAVGAALTNAYYPDVNRGFGQTARTFGSSMYGTAFSFFAAEFLNGALEAVHLKESRY